MADQPLLEVNCTNCPGNQACEDCVVRFFLAERDAPVVSLAGRGVVRRVTGDPAEGATGQPTPLLPPDLADALLLLQATGLAPEVLSIEELDTARAS